MSISRPFPLVLGALAIAGALVMLTLNIIFAVTLSHTSSPTNARVAACVASGLGPVPVVLLMVLLCRQFRYRNEAHLQDSGRGRQNTYLWAGLTSAFGILSAVSYAVVLGRMLKRIADLPQITLRSSTKSLIVGGFVVWTISLLSQLIFVLCIVNIQRKDYQRQIQPYHLESEPQTSSEMQEGARPSAPSAHGSIGYTWNNSMDSKSPRSSSARSRAGSDTVASFRSSLSHVVRPITSKTKLIPNGNKAPYRPTSIDSSHRDTSISIEDGFDSWDTSTVDAQSRQAVESASPTPPRFLETIPASPTGSRSPSPGFPLDLEPPKTRKRSRSYSPANSLREVPRPSRTTSPVESTNEAHIHPLFRTDSPTPPPSATPGTIVTAAPGAGLVISDRQSVRSIQRMRSGSLPSSPLMHSESLDSIRYAIEREEREKIEAIEVERTLTPPIPDWILGAGPRTSMTGYNSRKKTQAGLGKVGEVPEQI